MTAELPDAVAGTTPPETSREGSGPDRPHHGTPFVADPTALREALGDHVAVDPQGLARPVKCVCGEWESAPGVKGWERYEQQRTHTVDALFASGVVQPREDTALVLPDPKAGCACTPHEERDPYEPHIPPRYELEYEPACPEHSYHLYDPRTGAWVLRIEDAVRVEALADEWERLGKLRLGGPPAAHSSGEDLLARAAELRAALARPTDDGTPCPKHRALGVNPDCPDCDYPEETNR